MHASQCARGCIAGSCAWCIMPGTVRALLLKRQLQRSAALGDAGRVCACVGAAQLVDRGQAAAIDAQTCQQAAAGADLSEGSTRPPAAARCRSRCSHAASSPRSVPRALVSMAFILLMSATGAIGQRWNSHRPGRDGTARSSECSRQGCAISAAPSACAAAIHLERSAVPASHPRLWLGLVRSPCRWAGWVLSRRPCAARTCSSMRALLGGARACARVSVAHCCWRRSQNDGPLVTQVLVFGKLCAEGQAGGSAGLCCVSCAARARMCAMQQFWCIPASPVHAPAARTR